MAVLIPLFLLSGNSESDNIPMKEVLDRIQPYLSLSQCGVIFPIDPGCVDVCIKSEIAAWAANEESWLGNFQLPESELLQLLSQLKDVAIVVHPKIPDNCSFLVTKYVHPPLLAICTAAAMILDLSDGLNGKPSRFRHVIQAMIETIAEYNEGQHTFQWPDGREYRGAWKAAKFHGMGVWKGADGSSYEGAWRNGKRHGRGIYRWADGDEYEGEFQNDNFGGQGILRFHDGTYFRGRWEDDAFAEGFGWRVDNQKVSIETSSADKAIDAVVDSLNYCVHTDERAASLLASIPKGRFSVTKVDNRIDPSGTVLRISFRVMLLDAFSERKAGHHSFTYSSLDLVKSDGKWSAGLRCEQIFNITGL